MDNGQVSNVQNVFSTENSTNERDELKKKKSFLLPCVFVILFLFAIMGGVFAYNQFSKSPYEMAINNLFNLVKENNNIGKSFKVSGEVTVKSKNQSLNFLDNYSVDYTTIVNAKTKNTLTTFNINEKEISLLDFLVYTNDNKAYIQSKKLTDKTLYTDVIETNELVDEKDMNYLLDTLKKAFINALKDEKMTKNSKTLTINGKETKVTDNLYNLDKQAMVRVNTNFFNTIINDEEALKIIAKMSDKEVNEIKESLKEEINNAKDLDNYSDNIKLSIYTKGFFKSFVGFSIVEDNNMIDFVSDDKYMLLTVCADKEKITAEDKNGEINIKLTENNTTLATAKIIGDKSDAKIVIDIPEYLSLNMRAKVEKGAKIDNIDVKNAVNVEDMTDADSEEIINNLTKIIQKSEFYHVFQSYLTNQYVVE